MKIQESTIGFNGEVIHLNSKGLWVNSEGSSGYHAHFTGVWICYKCGHLCDCGEN